MVPVSRSSAPTKGGLECPKQSLRQTHWGAHRRPRAQLRGNLGVPSIVFMVVAAAAPLGVIGGVVPLGIA